MDGLKVNGPQAPETKAAGAAPPDSPPSPGEVAADTPRAAPSRRPAQRPASGYSRFVSMAKIGLVGSALALVALLAAWPTLKEIPQPRIGVERGQPEISRPRFISSDDANQPYSVTAARAQETAGQTNIVALEQPEAEMTENTGAWVTLRGDRGWYDRQTGILKMNGHVRILRDDGSELRTEEAFILVRDGTAWGDVYTEGQGPQGEVKAQGFRMKDRGKTMTFLNGTNANVTPMAAPAPEAAPLPVTPAVAPVPAAPVPVVPAAAPVEPPVAAATPPAPPPAEPPAAAVAPAEPPVPVPAAAAAAGAAAAAVAAPPPAPPSKPAAVHAAPAAPAKAAPPKAAPSKAAPSKAAPRKAAPAAAKKKPQPAPAKPAAQPKRKP